MTYYEMLRVSPTASAEEIKASWHRIAKRTHPDRNPGNKKAERVFKRCAEAYETLIDPELRAAYDATLKPVAKEESAPRAKCSQCGQAVQVGGKTLCIRCGILAKLARQRAEEEDRAPTFDDITSKAKEFEQPMPDSSSLTLLEALMVDASVRQAFSGGEKSGKKTVLEVKQGPGSMRIEVDPEAMKSLQRNLKTSWKIFKLVRDIIA